MRKPTASAAAPTASNTAPLGRSSRNHPCVTPRAKRTATAQEFHSSPLTIQSKRKKYDFATLIALNEEEEATRASAQRFSALLEREKKGKEAEKQKLDGHTDDDDDDDSSGGGKGLSQSAEDEGAAARQLKERMLEDALAAAARGEDEDEEGGSAGGMRVVRALERADVGGRLTSYYFFEQSEPKATLSAVAGRPFPTAAANGMWAILADAQDRARHFQSGFLFDIQLQFKNIPDEIFLWVLDEMCSETRRDLASEYVKLLRVCESQMERLVTPARLKQLFRSLGATRDVEGLSSHITLRAEPSDPYSRRDWLCLENFLQLMGVSSSSFSPSTRTACMQILLRLAMDPIAVENSGLVHEWRWTVDLVARSVPSSDWTSFVSTQEHYRSPLRSLLTIESCQCHDVCASLYASTERATLRYRAIAGLGPVVQQAPHTPTELQRRTLDLKRRLASAFFFDDTKRADTRPEDTVTIRAVIDRLEEDEFQLNVETDFQELHALMMMLNVALGDASKHRVLTPLTTGERERGLSGDFDAEVDELAESMKSMMTRVAPLSKGIHVSRIEAKNAMELIRERLLYQVRIRPVPKIKMFGVNDREGEDVSLPKQQELMEKFLSFKKKTKGVATAGMETEMVA